MTIKPKTNLLLLILALPFMCLAADWRDGDAKFTAKTKRPISLKIDWLTVSNVQANCEAESRQRGFGGFGYGVAACSFWSASTCTIVTSTRPTMHQLGHELRHCYEHGFH